MFVLVQIIQLAIVRLIILYNRGSFVVGNWKGVITWCNYMEGGVNMCIYSRIYTGNTLKRTPTPVGVPPPSRGGV